jgi:hypothetical protein
MLIGSGPAPGPSSCTPFNTETLCGASISCQWRSNNSTCLRPSVGLGTPFKAGDGLSNVGVSTTSLSNCSFSALLQSDGNFVISRGSAAIWSTKTSNRTGAKLSFQGDGNLVLYDSALKPIWNSGTSNNGGTGLLLSTNGVLAIVNGSGNVLWSSGSGVSGCN